MNVIDIKDGRHLCKIGDIQIPRAAMLHPHITEARACVHVISENIERVIGTTNGDGATLELYGWGQNVAPHTDDLGFIYFAPLAFDKSRVCTHRERVTLERGGVYRLNDFYKHWTHDTAPVVCLYYGPCRQPFDNIAMANLLDGVERLAAGDLDAPRVSNGFRVPLEGECYALVDDSAKLVRIAEAKRQGLVIVTCFQCDEMAIRVDHHFPYHWDGNACARHL